MKLNAGYIETETIINNGGTTTTTNIDAGSNWADGASHSFEVLVASTGAVTYKYDGSTSANAVAFSLDVGEIVTPFFYHIHAAASASGVVLQSFEHGRQ